MQCIHCRALNEDDERRCIRCGRRLHAAAPRPAPEVYPLIGATAPVLESLPGGRPVLSQSLPADPPAVGFQPSLFREPSQGPKVVPIPMLTPQPHGGERIRGVDRKTSRVLGARRGASSQQSLDFLGGAFEDHPLGTEVEAVIYCDAPVALPVHRLMAAAVDLLPFRRADRFHQAKYAAVFGRDYSSRFPVPFALVPRQWRHAGDAFCGPAPG